VLREIIKSLDTEKSLEFLTIPKLPEINSTDVDGWTSLHHAAWNGLAEVCECLLEREDFTLANACDNYGLTALHCACHRGHLKCVHVLAKSDAFVALHAADAQVDRLGVGWSARDIAWFCNHKDIVKAIDDASAKRQGKKK